MVFPVVGGDGKPTGYEIDNSLRFNRGDNPNLEKTFSGSPTSTTKCTISFWTKLADPSDTNAKNIFSAIKSGSNEDCIKFMGVNNGILNNLEFVFNNTSAGSMMVSDGTSSFVKFRDPSAWYHIVVAIDSTQGTASNRVKVYVNGTQRDVELRIDGGSQTTDVPLTQNYDLGFLTASKHQIGMNVESSNSEPYDGYLSEFYFVDGQQYAPTVFGETDDNGVWIPKDAKNDISFGNYGFYMEFKQTGTSANSSGMGADTSGNDNHFAASGLTTLDVTEDTPTNNFATINPLASIATLSEGNCKVVTTNGERMAGASTIGFENGKWYMEYKVTDINSINMTIGIDNENGLSFSDFRDNDDFWNASNTYAYENNGNKRSTGVNSSYGNSYTTGDIIGVAVDMDNRKIYFSKNGTFQNSGDPTTGSTGTGSAFDLTDGLTYFFQAADNDSSSGVTLEANFGNPSFSISSGNSDANGHGNFEYAVPSGYFALCTKNLAEYG